MVTKVQNWRTEVFKLRDWFCWTFLALILLDLFSLEHTMWRVLWRAWSLLMNLHATSTYLPTHWQFYRAFHNAQLGLSIWISDRSHHHHLSNLLRLTFLPTHQSIQGRQIANDLTEWISRMNNAMGGVILSVSWDRVHPIPLNQFTLFPIIPIYMVSTQNYESENQIFFFKLKI